MKDFGGPTFLLYQETVSYNLDWNCSYSLAKNDPELLTWYLFILKTETIEEYYNSQNVWC